MNPNLEQLRDFAARYAAAWCSQDPASVAAFFSFEGSLTINDGAPAIGRAEITRCALGFMSAFPDMQVRMDDVLVRNENVEFQWTLTGTNTGPGGTGKKVCISGFESWKFSADGLVELSLGNFDAALYQHQLTHGCDNS